MIVSASLLAQLQRLDTPTICNAIEMFEVRPRECGYGDGSVRSAFPELPAIVGLACPALFDSGAPPATSDPYGRVDALLEMMAASQLPTIVVAQDRTHPPAGAIFGEVMCGVYQQLGAAGLVTSGAGRDLEQVRALGFPVFLGSTIASHGHCHAVEVGSPVSVGGLLVSSGDVLHADANGFTTIPLSIVDEMPDVADEYLKCERCVLDACRHGEPTAAELIAARREMLAGLKALKQRVSRRTNATGRES